MPKPRSSSPRTVSIIGAGIIGLCTAYYLRREGVEVTVFDQDVIGAGASGGNAGEICPTSSDPLPSASMLREGVGQLFAPSSAVYIHPSQMLKMAGFIAGFTRRSTVRSYRSGLAALDLLNEQTNTRFDELADDGIGLSMRREGYVYCFRDKASATQGRDAAVRLAARGLAPEPDPLVGGSELRELEPAISLVNGWGYLQRGVLWIDPATLLADLAAWLRAHGVDIHEESSVSAISAGAAGADIRVDGQTHHSDMVVIAAGARSGQLTRSFGVNLGLKPGKGYSFSVRPPVMPQHVVNMPEAHAVATPMGERLRIAGTMEFDGTYDRMNPNRIEAIVRGSRDYLNDIDWNDRHEQWVGARPMTPDGLPHIGTLAKHPSVFIATGHNMLGLSLGPSSGATAAGLIVGKLSESDYEAFAPNRFSHFWVG